MVLLNIVYGFIMALCMTAAQMFLGGTSIQVEWFFLAVWAGWTTAHIIQDFVGYWLVRFFNRNKVVTHDMLR